MWPVSRVLDYRLQVQFPAGLPLSATLHSLSHMVDLITSNIIWCQRNLGGEQSRHATYWFPCRVHGPAVSAGGAWLRVESVINAASLAKWLGKDLTFFYLYHIFIDTPTFLQCLFISRRRRYNLLLLCDFAGLMCWACMSSCLLLFSAACSKYVC